MAHFPTHAWNFLFFHERILGLGSMTDLVRSSMGGELAVMAFPPCPRTFRTDQTHVDAFPDTVCSCFFWIIDGLFYWEEAWPI